MGNKFEVNLSYKRDWSFYYNTSAIQPPAYHFYHEIKCLNDTILIEIFCYLNGLNSKLSMATVVVFC